MEARSLLNCDALYRLPQDNFSAWASCLYSVQSAELKASLDAFFLVTMGVLIFIMQCGFAMLEAGSVRRKNVTNILLQNVLDSCISSLCYWALGWGFAYGEDAGHFIGSSQFLLIGAADQSYAKWFFQFAFVATGATIVSGALAERCRFPAYFAYCSAMAAFAYPTLTHWAWHPQGWLAQLGFRDFAGSAVVHLHGGTCALVGALCVGPRLGRFARPRQAMDGHSVPLTVAGGFVLMFGFFAFNGGSVGRLSGAGDGATFARGVVSTMLAAAAAALTALFAYRFLQRGTKWTVLGTMNALLTGMVAACAGCDGFEPWGAVVTGVGAGVVYMSVAWLVAKARIDDPVEVSSLPAVAVHFGGGLWGCVAAPLLVRGQGVVFGGGWRGLGVNVLGALAIVVWSIVTLGPVFLLLRLTGTLRASDKDQAAGLDACEHGEPAYPEEAVVAKARAATVRPSVFAQTLKEESLKETSEFPVKLPAPPTNIFPASIFTFSDDPKKA